MYCVVWYGVYIPHSESIISPRLHNSHLMSRDYCMSTSCTCTRPPELYICIGIHTIHNIYICLCCVPNTVCARTYMSNIAHMFVIRNRNVKQKKNRYCYACMALIWILFGHFFASYAHVVYSHIRVLYEINTWT